MAVLLKFPFHLFPGHLRGNRYHENHYIKKPLPFFRGEAFILIAIPDRFVLNFRPCVFYGSYDFPGGLTGIVHVYSDDHHDGMPSFFPHDGSDDPDGEDYAPHDDSYRHFSLYVRCDGPDYSDVDLLLPGVDDFLQSCHPGPWKYLRIQEM